MISAFEVFIQLLNFDSKSSSISLLRNFSKTSSTFIYKFLSSSHFPVVNIHKSKIIVFKV